MTDDFYQLALQGRHTDLSARPHPHPMKAANQAITLHLRDLFTALSRPFAHTVLDLTGEEIVPLLQDIECYEAVYLDDVLADEFTPFIATGELPTGFGHAQPRRQRFERAYRSLSAAGQAYFRGLLFHTKHTATLEPYLQARLTGRYDRYLWSPIKDFSETPNHISDTAVIPVGGYGEAAARRMLLTTHVLISLADRSLRLQSEEIEARYWDMLAWETSTGRTKREALENLQAGGCDARGTNGPEQPWAHKADRQNVARNAVMDTFKEGIQSAQASISSLMAEPVAGFATAEACLAQIIQDKLPQQFSRRVPFGYTLPVIRRGRFLPDIVATDSASRLRLSAYFGECSRYFKEEYLEERVYPNGAREPGFFGLGCPASFKVKGFDKTAIDLVLDAYWHVFQLIGNGDLSRGRQVKAMD